MGHDLILIVYDFFSHFFLSFSLVLFPTGKSDGWGTWQTTRTGLQAGEGTEKCREWKQEEQTSDLKRELDCNNEEMFRPQKRQKRQKEAYKKHMTLFSVSLFLHFTTQALTACPPNLAPSSLMAQLCLFLLFHLILFVFLVFSSCSICVTNLCAF